MIGTKLADRYEILAELGRGGMGVVYKARDPVLSREVAVKLIPPGNLTADMEERFLREAQVVAQMDHPGIVPIHDLGRHEGSLFFVMPVVPGMHLRHLLREKKLRLGDVLDIGAQVADALEYSHTLSIVHRDIKPENIMVATDPLGNLRVRVMDFGLAHASTEHRLTKTGTLVGTVAYLSPEQISGREFDGRTDVYALGTVLYECLAGEPPFSGETQSILYRIVHQIPQSLKAMGADVREELEEILLWALQKDPARRPQRAGQLAEALRSHRAKLHEDEYTRSVILTTSRVLARPSPSPFIGREKEFAALQHRLNAAMAGECQFAVVAGEPGIGKTRLLEELANLARACRFQVLRGRFVEQDRAFSYQGFCELIQDYFRGRDAGGSAVSRPDFSDLAADLLGLFPVLSEIGELRSAAQSDVKEGAPAEARKVEDRVVVFELLARTLTRIAGGKPLLLILENLHGAEVSVEALQYVVRRLAPTATLVAGSYRQTEVDKRHPLAKMLDTFADDPRFVSLTLGPFSPSEHRALVESAAGGGAKVADRLATRLYEATEGNPFFTKELVKSLIDSGGIARDESSVWAFSRGAAISSDVLPATIQQAIEKRIQRLSEELRDVLSTASVIGRSFEFKDLEALSEDAKGLEDALDKLVREGILEEERESRGDRLAFASGIVRDVLYGALARRKRRSLHRRYAELLEKRYAGRAERAYPELVHHFSQGDVPDKTVEYGLKLAKKSLDAFSPEDTVRAAKTALEYLEDEDWPGDSALAGEARLLLAQAHRLQGDLDGALSEAEAAASVLEKEAGPARAVEAYLFAADTAWQGRRVDETRRWVERGIEAARTLEQVDPLTRLLSLAALVASMRGEPQRAATYLAEAERLAPREQDGGGEIPRGGRLVVALANPVAATEPGLVQIVEEPEVLSNVFETLVTTDAQGNLVPWLCEGWKLADQGRTVLLDLRRDVHFSDGAPLTAAAVKASFERAIRLTRDVTPAAFASIRGVAEYVQETAPEVSGLVAASQGRLEIHLTEAIPILPALLTDSLAAVVHAVSGDAGERLSGSGPFRVELHTAERIVLVRDDAYWRGTPARLDAIEFRPSMSATAIAAGLKSGELDIARDVSPEDLEELLRDPRFRAGLVEAPQKSSYFVLFNASSPAGGNEALRRALAGVLRTQDFVWSALGRFALPATGILPPGILGHDAGRRRPHLSKDKALELLRGSGLSTPLTIRASVHPIFQDRYRALTSALFGLWQDLGVEVEVVTHTMAEYGDSWNHNAGIDVLVGRWIADYDDPDNFTFSQFHSRSGNLRAYFSSPETDRRLEEARVETRPDVRASQYRSFEDELVESAALIPLFHDVAFRLASPQVKGLHLRSTAPYVNYAELGKAQAAEGPAARARAWVGGVVTVPITNAIPDLDPSLTSTVEQGEVIPNVFETLTRTDEGARVVPWLASECSSEAGGMRFRFRLRAGVRFHDGRRLTARDVRYSFERLLLNTKSDSRWFLLPVKGAKKMVEGITMVLEGFHIVSPSEFTVELERPVSLFPTMISYPAVAIVPEGTDRLGSHWRDGCAGTGPFRVASFEPGRQLTLERNPHYWREGYPRSEGLVFRFGISPEEIKKEFVAGRLSLASDLLPADAEALRQDPTFASGYQEIPRLSTYLIAFNTKAGVLHDPRLRRGIASALDVPSLVRRSLGRLAIPAHGLIPPGLLGYSPAAAAIGSSPSSDPEALATVSKETVELGAIVHPVFFGEYAALFKELTQAFREMGFHLRVANRDMAGFLAYQYQTSVDLIVGRWDADYPDADSFVYGVLRTEEGFVGRYCGSAVLDQLAERGRAEADPSVRHSIYRQVEELVARDTLLIPLFHEQVYRFARPEVEGLRLSLSTPVVSYDNLRVRR